MKMFIVRVMVRHGYGGNSIRMILYLPGIIVRGRYAIRTGLNVQLVTHRFIS